MASTHHPSDIADLGPATVAGFDRQDHFSMAASLADQLEAGWRAARDDLRAFDPPAERPDGVLVCGMGGSAIGADVVRACMPELAVPFEVVRGYDAPAWVSSRTLVVAVSYSGNTEETLSCVDTALARGCRPVFVATGGELGALARERDRPLITVPSGMQPRAALGYLTTSLAATLCWAGLAADFAPQVAEAAEIARSIAAELHPAVPDEANAAKPLARRLHGHISLIYGAGVTAPAARRWKGQINENGKAPAFFAEFPELNHNEIVGWTGDPALARTMHVVLLVDPQANERIAKRIDYTAEHLAGRMAGVDVVTAAGASPFARICSVITIGDFVSLYLAVLSGVDPTPVTAIEELKRHLRG
jgi:glucose/mannose-6-phosphate isomerase